MCACCAQELRFAVNGVPRVLRNPNSQRTLLQYLREEEGLTGTKLGCGEGGCGACTVLLSSRAVEGDDVHHRSANACITPLCAVDGCAVMTVEGIGSTEKGLHPVQVRSSPGPLPGFSPFVSLGMAVTPLASGVPRLGLWTSPAARKRAA